MKLEKRFDLDPARGLSFNELVDSVRKYYKLDEWDQLSVQSVMIAYGYNLKEALEDFYKGGNRIDHLCEDSRNYYAEFGEWFADASCLWEAEDIDDWTEKDFEDYAKVMEFNNQVCFVEFNDKIVCMVN